MNTIFSVRLKELRKELDLTQIDFASIIGTTQAALSSYEKGDRLPSIEILTLISEKFNISIDWLCGLSEQPSRSPQILSYSDFFKRLVQLCSVKYTEESDKSGKPLLSVSFSDKSSNLHFIAYDDPNFNDFFTDWDKMHNLFLDHTIDEELYNLWLEKELAKYNFSLNALPAFFH